ncbi:MAG: CsbD family protein [Lacunisphaera sp.]|nr:CsbD family protein [Lacunisphaera sp.]MDB6165287.1 CsbD family protein [Lacunisphaera sp.]
MNTDTLKGIWSVAKQKLKERYENLTDNDLAYIHGGQDEMFGQITRKTGASRDELDRYLREACGCDC